jgi:hypothetical protein
MGTSVTLGASPAAITTAFNALWVQDASNIWVADSVGEVYTSTDGATMATNWAAKTSGLGMAAHGVFGNTNGLLVGGDPTGQARYLTPLSSTTWSNANCNQGQKVLGIWADTNYFVCVGAGGKGAKNTNPAGGSGWTNLAFGGGNGWTGGPDFTAVHGTADNNVWMVSIDGQLGVTDLTAANSKAFQRTAVSGAVFNAVWVKSTTEVWVAGNGSKVWQYDVTNNRMNDKSGDLPANYNLTGIWGDGTSIWVIGNNGTAGGIFKH